MPVKFIAGMILGAALSVGGAALLAQTERAMHHPRIVRAIAALESARAHMDAPPSGR